MFDMIDTDPGKIVIQTMSISKAAGVIAGYNLIQLIKL